MSYNAFNRSLDSTYSYSSHDMLFLARCLVDEQLKSAFAIAPPFERKDDESLFDFLKDIVETFKTRQTPVFAPFRRQDGSWALIALTPGAKNQVLMYYDPLNDETYKKTLEEIEVLLRDNFPYFDLKSPQEMDERDEVISGICVLKNLKLIASLLENPRDIMDQGSRTSDSLSATEELETLRRDFANIYKYNIMLDIIRKHDKQVDEIRWERLNVQAKHEILRALKPWTQTQLIEICDKSDVELEAADLLRSAITEHDAEVAKIILKVGLRVNEGCLYKGTQQVSFCTILDEEKEKNSESKQLNLIGALLNKYGCTSKVSESYHDLRKKAHQDIIFKLAEANKTKKEVYIEFKNMLKTSLLTAINSLLVAASGRMELHANHTKHAVADKGVEEGLEYVAHHFIHSIAHNVPFITSVLMSLHHDHKQGKEVKKVVNLIRGCFPDNSKNDSITDYYTIGVIEHDSERILHAMEKLKDQSLKKPEEQVVKLLEHYTEMFVKFVMEGKPQAIKSGENLGLYMCKQLFHTAKISEQDFQNLEQNTVETNSKLFAKLLSRLEEMPNSTVLFQKWKSAVGEIYELNDPDVKSLILAGSERIVMFFISDKKKDFNKFYDSMVYKPRTSLTPKDIGFGRLIEELLLSSKYKNTPIYILGCNQGAAIADQVLQQKLLKIYRIDPQLLSIYTFGQKLPAIPGLKCCTEPLKAKEFLSMLANQVSDSANQDQEQIAQQEGPGGPIALAVVPEKVRAVPEKPAANSALLQKDIRKLYFIDKGEGAGKTNRPPLINAASDGNKYVAEFLLSKSSNPNTKDKNGQTAMMEATSRGHLAFVEFLQSKGADINHKDQFAQTPILGAIFYGHLDVVKYLLAQNAHLNIDRGLTVAAAGGNLETLLFLLEKEHTVALKDLLVIASSRNRLEIIQHYIPDDGQINEIQEQYGKQLLFTAISEGHNETLQYLQKKRVSLEIQELSNYQYLINAASNGHHDVIQYIINVIASNHNITVNVREMPLLSLDKGSVFDVNSYLDKNVADQMSQPSYFSVVNLQKHISIVSFRKQLVALEEDKSVMTVEEYEQILSDLEEQGYSKFSLTMIFVSECMRDEQGIDTKYQADKAKREEFKLKKTQYLAQFFEVDPSKSEKVKKIVKYHHALKLLLGYESDRLDKILDLYDQANLKASPSEIQTLVILIHIKKGTSHFYSPEKRYSFLEVAEQMLESWFSEDRRLGEYWYLQGEIQTGKDRLAKVPPSPAEAKLCYIKAIKLDPFFYHPWVQLIHILCKEEELKMAQEIYENLIKDTVPIDVEIELKNTNEIIMAQDYLRLRKQKALEERDFKLALQEALLTDVKKTVLDLFDVMPLRIGKKYGDSLQKQVNYCFEMLNGFWHRRSLANESELINKSHPFFQPIHKLIKKIQEIKQKCLDVCSLMEDFKGREVDRKRYYALLDELISYYENYIDEVVQKKTDDKKAGILEKCDVTTRVKVISEKNDKFLFKNSVVDHFAPEKKKPAKNSAAVPEKVPEQTAQKYGTHQVIAYPQTGDHQVYYKINPYAPGVEFAVASLYAEILPNSTPETLLFQITNEDEISICQASKGVTGINFAEVVNQQGIIQKIDMKNFSGLLISSLLARPGDAKPDNFVMKFNYDKRGDLSAELISIDNDIAFSREKLDIAAGNNQIYSDMLNILFLLPQMDKPVSPYIRNELRKKNPVLIIAQWLETLYKKNRQYKRAGFNQDVLAKSQLPIKLPPKTAQRIYLQLHKIIQLLQNEAATHQDIFKALCPSICGFYKMSRDVSSMVNSLKNLYVAAGASPLLVQSLYSTDKMTSKTAWNTLSKSKIKSSVEFRETFSQPIDKAAEEFIATIDFSKQDLETIKEAGSKLRFTANLTLNKISYEKLAGFCEKFERLESVQIINCEPSADENRCRSFIEDKYRILPTFKKTQQKNIASLKVTEPLNIDSIWDIFDKNKCPVISKDLLLFTRKTRSININEQDTTGNTALHRAVMLKKNNIVEVLLDCGIDHEIKNNAKKTALELAKATGCPIEIQLRILDCNLDYLSQLVQENRYEEVQIIAETIAEDRLDDYMDTLLAGDELTLLEVGLKDKSRKALSMVILKRLSKVSNLGLIHQCIQNYDDSDVNILVTLVEKAGKSNLQKIINFVEKNTFPADLALSDKKYHMLAYLVNMGAKMTDSNLTENVSTILKARKWGFRIDATDFETQFDYSKLDDQGKSLFYHMCIHQDAEVLMRYSDLLSDYYPNKEEQKYHELQELAETHRFVEWFELQHANASNDDLYDGYGHKLAKGENQKITRILKDLGISVTIREAVQGIDLNGTADLKRNTYFQKIIKSYLSKELKQKQISSEEKELIKFIMHQGADMNLSFREDKNTALHLIARSGYFDLLNVVLNESKIELQLEPNLQQLSSYEIAEKYGHRECCKAIKDRLKESRPSYASSRQSINSLLSY